MMQKRQYKILKLLYRSDGFVTVERLAADVQCSLKTIRNDLKQLGSFLEEHGLGKERLRECHLQRGFRDIGYHFYITRDGVLHHCRPVSEIGAHVRGFNRHSIGICYEGGLDENGRPADTRTTAQRFALLDLLTILITGF